MSDATLTGVLASVLDLERVTADMARALDALKTLLVLRTGRLLTQDGRPLAGDDDVTLEV